MSIYDTTSTISLHNYKQQIELIPLSHLFPQRRQKVAIINTFFPSDAEVELRELLSPELRLYYNQWRKNIKHLLIIFSISFFLLIISIAQLIFFGVTAIGDKEPVQPAGVFVKDDLLSWIQIVALFTILYITIVKATSQSSLEKSQLTFLNSLTFTNISPQHFQQLNNTKSSEFHVTTSSINSFNNSIVASPPHDSSYSTLPSHSFQRSQSYSRQ